MGCSSVIMSLMLKVRLQRVGRKHDPSFRVVVTDSKNGPKSGKALETIGNYDARRDVKEINAERVKHWISKGAQLSDTVHNILVGKKIIEGKKINVLPKKTPLKKDNEKAGQTNTVAREKIVEEVKVVEEAKPDAKPLDIEAEVVENATPALEPEVVSAEVKEEVVAPL